MKKLLTTAAITLLLGACGSQTQVVAPTNLTHLSVSAMDFAYSPSRIQLTAGQRYDLTIVNQSGDDHDMKTSMPIANLKYVQANNDADEQQENTADSTFDVDFDAHATSEVIFTPTTPGTYEFHCDEPGHTEAGMSGTFVVR